MSKTTIVKDGVAIKENTKSVLHNVFIIDASGSMHTTSMVDGVRRSKYDVAADGINSEINELKKTDQGDVNISVFEFDSTEHGSERITEHYFNTPLKDVSEIKFRGASGNTPLYQTIGYVIEKMLRTASNKDTVLIKIFTDGAHNCFWGKYTEQECKSLIKDVETNREFIVTFVGKQEDVNHAVAHLGMSVGNTMVYDGSSRGMDMAFMASTASTNKLLNTKRKGISIDKSKFYSNT